MPDEYINNVGERWILIKKYNELIQLLKDSVDHFKAYDDETGTIYEFVKAWKKKIGELER